MKLLYAAVLVSLLYANGLFARAKDTFWSSAYEYSDPLRDELFRNEATLRLMDTKKSKVFILGSSSVSEGIDFSKLNEAGEHEFYRFGIPLSDPYTVLEWQGKLLAKKPEKIIYMINPIRKNQIQKKRLQSWLEKFSTYFQYRTSFYNAEKRMFLDRLGIESWVSQEYAYYTKRVPMESIHQQAKEWDSQDMAKAKELFLDFAVRTFESGTSLVVIERPTYALIDPALKEYGRDEFKLFLEYQSKRFGFRFIPRESLPLFRDEDFNDFTHLSKTGREKMTAFVSGLTQF